MKRNPTLAHKVTLKEDVKALRHVALDSLTALSLAAQMLNKENLTDDPVKELEYEQKVYDLLREADWNLFNYLKNKLAHYENELLIESNRKEGMIVEKDNVITESNVVLKRHKNELNELAQRRGVE